MVTGGVRLDIFKSHRKELAGVDVFGIIEESGHDDGVVLAGSEINASKMGDLWGREWSNGSRRVKEVRKRVKKVV